jgi:hypothetical protein
VQPTRVMGGARGRVILLDARASRMLQRCLSRASRFSYLAMRDQKTPTLASIERERQKPSTVGVIAFVLHTIALNAIADPAAAACDSSDRAFVCVERNPEDLVRLSQTPWVIASQLNWRFSGGKVSYAFGPLEAIRTDTREVRRLFPAPETRVDWDRRAYPDCAAPPEKLSSHGLNVRSLGSQKFRLYVVNHGGRESIEIFDLQASIRQLGVTWRGCVLTPKGTKADSVAPMPGDGVAVTLLAGAGPAVWLPARGWSKVEGVSEYDHGIEVSRDGEWLYLVLHRPKGSLVRVPARGGVPQTLLQSDVMPDNLRWGEDGRLYMTGFFPEELKECLDRPATVCDIGFVVTQIDPVTLETREVFRTHGIKGAFGAGTTALQVGEQLWVGTWFGDRIAILEPQR